MCIALVDNHKSPDHIVEKLANLFHGDSNRKRGLRVFFGFKDTKVWPGQIVGTCVHKSPFCVQQELPIMQKYHHEVSNWPFDGKW